MHTVTAIALSGGIDSLVSAALLKEQGHPLIGLHFLTGYEATGTRPTAGPAIQEHPRSDHQREFNSIELMADQLDIPIHIIDLKEEFKSIVVDYFIDTYGSGRTPNPCLVCNPLIKFDILYKKGLALGADTMATGHYARIRRGPDRRMHLLRGKDPAKDQSYFLARLTQAQLQRIILPLGHLTKEQTRRIALQKRIQPATSQESQDICFIKNDAYGDFLERQPGFVSQPGDIEDLSGRKIGRHKGLHRYTIGQRRGINCPAQQPFYVHHMDMARNCLVVAHKEDLQTAECTISDINWIAAAPHPHEPIQVNIRLRYRHTAVPATLIPLNSGNARILFHMPQNAVTPGQGAVFYQGDEVLGGGWIQ